MSWTGGRPCVQNLIPGGPAEVAGLQPGECITAIDGVPTTDGTLADAVEAIRGVAGTSVRLVIERSGASVTMDVVRGNVRFEE
jgi:C-terminal processing protease CtpA/Prc